VKDRSKSAKPKTGTRPKPKRKPGETPGAYKQRVDDWKHAIAMKKIDAAYERKASSMHGEGHDRNRRDDACSYEPEIWPVPKDIIYAAIPALEAGLEYARDCLTDHDALCGRECRKNRVAAEAMENDIRNMERTLAMLRACGPAAP
jgi:hypothetical protein